ncbi:MAG: hypothetical protein ABIG43_03620 [Chloroflexota bacterium]
MTEAYLQRKRRILFFILTIVIGITAGLVYGWLINPVAYTDTGPHTLRLDYKTDYILMVAEIYHADQNINAAVANLGFLGSDSPVELVNQAVVFAEQVGYASADLELMLELVQSLYLSSSLTIMEEVLL